MTRMAGVLLPLMFTCFCHLQLSILVCNNLLLKCYWHPWCIKCHRHMIHYYMVVMHRMFKQCQLWKECFRCQLLKGFVHKHQVYNCYRCLVSSCLLLQLECLRHDTYDVGTSSSCCATSSTILGLAPAQDFDSVVA